jgi:hypothetical protein
MKEVEEDSLVIAIDYYDGEAEGFARIDSRCFYFQRVDVDDLSNINQYIFVSVDDSFFEELARLAGAVRPPNGVLVYSGSIDALNHTLDKALPNLRGLLATTGRRLHGHSVLDSLKAHPDHE